MFKNLIAYQITGELPFGNEEALTAALADQPLTPLGQHDLSCTGWVEAMEGAGLVRTVAGVHLITFAKEEKILPAAAIRQAVQKKVAEVESRDNRKVYRKERDQIKDDVISGYLPKALSKQTRMQALILPQQGWILVDTSSHKRAEEMLSMLRNCLGTLPLALPDVKQSPAAVMSSWVEHTSTPNCIELGYDCRLDDTMAEHHTVTIKGDDLNSSEEVRSHLEAGMRVTRLAVEFDQKYRFEIQQDLRITKLKLTDLYLEQHKNDTPEEALEALDSDIALFPLEFTALLKAALWQPMQLNERN